MRRYYSEYVGHCARFYIRNKEFATFKSEVERLNFEAAETAYKEFTEREQEIFDELFKADDFVETANMLARAFNYRQAEMWKLISEFEKRVAIHRGLL